MKKSIRYTRQGDTTPCVDTYENGVSHAAIDKHPDERDAQELAYKALQAYIQGIPFEHRRAMKEDLENVLQHCGGAL